MSTSKLPLYREAAIRKLASPEDLDRLLQITNVRAWLLLAALGCLLLAGFVWAIWGSITTSVEASGVLRRQPDDTLSAITYVTLADAQQLSPGMQVELRPSSIRPEVNGALLGTVEDVAEQPATRQTINATLGTSALVDAFIRAEQVFAVTVSLNTANDAYQWTVGNTQDVILPDGTPTALSIIVRREPPISRLFART